MKFDGTVALVTGGATGIGRAVCLDLARAGARAIAVNFSRSRADAEAAVAELREAGADAWAIQADVADREQVGAMVAEAAARHGRLDILVNNAGTTRFIAHPDLDALTPEVWDAIFDVNLRGAFWCAQAAAPHLRQAHGAIVNIASIAALRASGSSIPYGASKAALTQLTRGLAVALAPEVRVNSVNPGLVATRWFRQVSDELAEAQEKAMGERTPLKRITTPEEVSQVVMGLLAMDMVTGEHVVVDGGLHLLY